MIGDGMIMMGRGRGRVRVFPMAAHCAPLRSQEPGPCLTLPYPIIPCHIMLCHTMPSIVLLHHACNAMEQRSDYEHDSMTHMSDEGNVRVRLSIVQSQQCSVVQY